MAPVACNPIKLYGPWTEGYVLDRHTKSSVPTGDPYHPWDTARTELGELLFQLKYRNRNDVIGAIVDTAEHFVRNGWKGLPQLDCAIPMPPSDTGRSGQPVIEIARTLADQLGIQLLENAVTKIKPTSQMKNIQDWAERRKLLGEAIQIGTDNVNGKSLLLFDDLTESGATLGRVTDVLLKEGGAAKVFALVLTRTK